MTSSLFDIVRDVPREAWPVDVVFDEDTWTSQTTDTTFTEYHATLMFEASLTRWLIGDHYLCPQDRADHAAVYLLAAACKAVKP